MPEMRAEVPSGETTVAAASSIRALSRWPLLKGERDQIMTIQSVDQLAEVYAALADERGLMAKGDQRRLALLGIVMMMVMAGATVLTMIYLLMVQNDSFLDSLKGLRGH